MSGLLQIWLVVFGCKGLWRRHAGMVDRVVAELPWLEVVLWACLRESVP
jgi:hypothetical protein